MPFVTEAMLIALASAGLAVLWLTSLHSKLVPLAPWDIRMLMAVHRHASPMMDRIMMAFTLVGAIRIFAPVVILAVCLLIWKRQRHIAAVLGFAMLGALVLNETLKLYFHRARPVLGWSLGDEHTFSYPSGHALFATTLYGVLAYLVLRRGISRGQWAIVVTLAVALPLLIGFSRIYFAEHFPTDVLAGYGVGLIWLAGIVAIDRAWLLRA